VLISEILKKSKKIEKNRKNSCHATLNFSRISVNNSAFGQCLWSPKTSTFSRPGREHSRRNREDESGKTRKKLLEYQLKVKKGM
jgi:hypothetical protein